MLLDDLDDVVVDELCAQALGVDLLRPFVDLVLLAVYQVLGGFALLLTHGVTVGLVEDCWLANVVFGGEW